MRAEYSTCTECTYARIHPPTHLHIFNDYERHQIFTPFVFVFVVIFSVFLVFYYSLKFNHSQIRDAVSKSLDKYTPSAIQKQSLLSRMQQQKGGRFFVHGKRQICLLNRFLFTLLHCQMPNTIAAAKKIGLRRNEAKKRCQNSTLNIFLQNVLRIFFKCVN